MHVLLQRRRHIQIDHVRKARNIDPSSSHLSCYTHAELPAGESSWRRREGGRKGGKKRRLEDDNKKEGGREGGRIETKRTYRVGAGLLVTNPLRRRPRRFPLLGGAREGGEGGREGGREVLPSVLARVCLLQSPEIPAASMPFA